MGHFAEAVARGATDYWPLTDAGATADNLLAARDGSFSGSVAKQVEELFPGAPGAVADFTGGHVIVADHSAFSSHAGANGLLTVEVAAEADSLSPAVPILFAKGASGPSRYEWTLLATSTGEIEFQVSTLAGAAVGYCLAPPGSFTIGVPHHLVGTYNRAAQVARLYLDGVLVASDLAMSGLSSDSTATVTIGRRQSDGTVWDGRIGPAAYYPVALTADDVTALYDALTTAPVIGGSGLIVSTWTVGGAGSKAAAGSGELGAAFTPAGSGAKAVGGTGTIGATFSLGASGTVGVRPPRVDLPFPLVAVYTHDGGGESQSADDGRRSTVLAGTGRRSTVLDHDGRTLTTPQQ